MAPRATLASTPAPPTLSRRRVLRAFAAIAASSALTGCGAAVTRFANSTTSATTPTPTPTPTPVLPLQPLPVGVLTAASLTIASTHVGSFAPGFLGLAYEKQSLQTPLFAASNTDLPGLFARLGPGVLRIGGASVDQSVWIQDGPGQTPGQIAPADVDALAAFLRATGWSCIYGINLGGSATGATTPALAAAEVAYVARQLGPALLGVELGNECEAYGATFYPGNWSVESFEALWQQYRAAIVAVTPSAPLCGPAAASDLDAWTLPFGEYVTRDQISLLTQHYTRTTAPDATAADLVTPDTALSAELLTLHYGAQSIGIPFRIDALSSCASGVSDTYASALSAIDTIFQTALAGASGINLQSGGQQPGSAIADSNGTLLGPQPIFYGAALAAMAGSGSLLATQLSAAALNVTAYALQTTTGISLIVVNKDSTQNLDLAIDLPQAMSAATLQQMTQLSPASYAPDLAATSGITLQGATISPDGAFDPAASYALTLSGDKLSCYVPALSAVLIQLA